MKEVRAAAPNTEQHRNKICCVIPSTCYDTRSQDRNHVPTGGTAPANSVNRAVSSHWSASRPNYQPTNKQHTGRDPSSSPDTLESRLLKHTCIQSRPDHHTTIVSRWRTVSAMTVSLVKEDGRREDESPSVRTSPDRQTESNASQMFRSQIFNP